MLRTILYLVLSIEGENSALQNVSLYLAHNTQKIHMHLYAHAHSTIFLVTYVQMRSPNYVYTPVFSECYK